MKLICRRARESGKVGKVILLWILGVPLSVAVLGVWLAGCK